MLSARRLALVVLVIVVAAWATPAFGAAVDPPGSRPYRPPPDVKDPVVNITSLGDGVYRIAWANMVPPYEVSVAGDPLTTTRLTSVEYTPANPGDFPVLVADSKGTEAGNLLVNPGVLAEGANDYGQLGVSGWSGITDVAAGYAHSVGLTAAGSVVATGSNTYGQCNTGAWSAVTDIEAGGNHTLGRHADGTVVAVGRNDYGQCNVGSWTGVTALAAGTSFSVGLKTDGTVVAAGRNQYGQCNVGSWTNVVAIACGSVHTLGLRSDGTVLYAGPSALTGGMFNLGQGNVGGWSSVAAIGAGHTHSLAVSGGAPLYCGSNPDGALTGLSTWSSLAAVDGGLGNTVGLCTDGTALVAGRWWDSAAGDYAAFTQVPAWTGLDQVSSQGDFILGLVK